MDKNPSKETKGPYHWIRALSSDIQPQPNSDRVGKWMVFREPELIDSTWAKIQNATTKGNLGIAAKVSTAYSMRYGGYTTHVICIYTKSYKNKKDVKRVLKQLRNLGITELLYYKTDQATRLGMYGDNSWEYRSSDFENN